MRSILSQAGPVKDGDKRYSNISEDETEQDKVQTEFQKSLRDRAESGDERYAKIKTRVFGRLLFDVLFQEVLAGDVAYAVFSGLFVFCFIWYHLESLFMTLLSMGMILMSFPVSYLIYTGICQITMNTTLNQLTIFIVLGIAADDIFVFCDAWRQSEFIPSIASDEKRRMAYAFKRSFRAIAVTSSTTAVAFLANAASDIRPIRGFGIFAAIIVPVNFLIVILIMPSV